MIKEKKHMENKKRFLTMLEVSQKQAYIFSSNKLQDNIINSAVIAKVLESTFFEKVIKNKDIYNEKSNMVYSGGGHTILEFETKEQAIEFTKQITKFVYKKFDGLIIFATTMEYMDYDENGKELNAADNCKRLTAQLEKKKALRLSAFHQGSFGIEKTNTTTLCPESADEICEEKQNIREEEKKYEIERYKKNLAEYKPAYEFSNLGCSKYDKNFIAVVHIDGNAMGKRVENLDEESKKENWNWDTYKAAMKKFSGSIAEDFKTSYDEMEKDILASIKNGMLNDLNISTYFPVRKVILAGDDICFVSDGRIGIECAVRFLENLRKKTNKQDEKEYAACAGVAIVHQKYPFYKAYELAEKLCENAKKYAASLSEDGSGKEVSAIDWHIEFGEIKDTLEEIRNDYKDVDGNPINARPYLVFPTRQVMKEQKTRLYINFKEMIMKLQKREKEENFAQGKLKELRGALKRGKKATEYFLRFNKLEDIVINNERELLFDVIELLDTYIALIE